MGASKPKSKTKSKTRKAATESPAAEDTTQKELMELLAASRALVAEMRRKLESPRRFRRGMGFMCGPGFIGRDPLGDDRIDSVDLSRLEGAIAGLEKAGVHVGRQATAASVREFLSPGSKYERKCPFCGSTRANESRGSIHDLRTLPHGCKVTCDDCGATFYVKIDIVSVAGAALTQPAKHEGKLSMQMHLVDGVRDGNEDTSAEVRQLLIYALWDGGKITKVDRRRGIPLFKAKVVLRKYNDRVASLTACELRIGAKGEAPKRVGYHSVRGYMAFSRGYLQWDGDGETRLFQSEEAARRFFKAGSVLDIKHVHLLARTEEVRDLDVKALEEIDKDLCVSEK